MRQSIAVGMSVILAGWMGVASARVQTDLDLAAVDDALTMIRSGGASDRARFHERYRVTVGKAPLDYLDVVTPFRRIVLAGSARAAAGDRSFGQRQALEMLKTSGGRLDIYLELTFHPLNTYISIPDYEVTLGADGGTTISPAERTHVLRWTPRLEALPQVPLPSRPSVPAGSQLLGATVVAQFELKDLNPRGTYDVVFGLEKREAGRARVDFGPMR